MPRNDRRGACLALIRMFRNVVRGFSLVRMTLKGRATKGGRASHDKEAVRISYKVLFPPKNSTKGIA